MNTLIVGDYLILPGNTIRKQWLIAFRSSIVNTALPVDTFIDDFILI